MCFAGVLLLALASCSAVDRPRIGEVLYDAVGDDGGHEFVELFSPLDWPIPLAGLRLEAGDGSGPGRWTLRWIGGAADTIPAGGRFVIGGALVTPRPQAVVTLDLQNGPDAVRLVWPDGAIELLGYGAHEFAEYACGAPAPDVPSGQSLARIPDDSDLGGNALDFRATSPTPGRANLPGRDVALAPGALALSPSQPAPDEPARLAVTLLNHGATALAAGEVRLAVASSLAAAPLAAAAVVRALATGDSARLEVVLPGLPGGKQWIRVRLAAPGDEVPDNDADSLRVRAGAGPLALTEIQFHPADGEGEWVEVWNRSGAPLVMTDFTLSDRGGTPGAVRGERAPLPPDSLAVLAQDPAALLARLPGLDAARVWTVAPWPSLNDREDPAGVADVLSVSESDGTPCDRVAYSSAGVPRGVPLERRSDGSWGAASDPAGTPLARPRPPVPGSLRLTLRPRRVRAGEGVEIGWSLPWVRGDVAAEIYDLAGRRVAAALPAFDAGAQGSRRWTVAGLSPGLYVLALRAADSGGRETLVASQPLRVDGPAP